MLLKQNGVIWGRGERGESHDSTQIARTGRCACTVGLVTVATAGLTQLAGKGVLVVAIGGTGTLVERRRRSIKVERVGGGEGQEACNGCEDLGGVKMHD